MRKVRIAGDERTYPRKEPHPYRGRWVSPLFDNVSAVRVGGSVPLETNNRLADAVMRSQG
jgi:hypothetical protein